LNNLKKKFEMGESAIGTMISVFDIPALVNILKNCGIEWFFYDAEHGYPNIDRLYSIFGYARFIGLPGLIRIPEISKTEILRAMDMGVDGIICSNVKTEIEAREIVRLSKYAPLGERGVSLTRPHTSYKQLDALSYMEKANNNTMIICQMESLDGVNNLDSILKVNAIDGVLIGPNDLTQSMGILNQLDHPKYLAVVSKIIDICKKNKKIIGMPSKNIKMLNYWKDKGVQLLQWGSDVSLLMSKIKEELKR